MVEYSITKKDLKKFFIEMLFVKLKGLIVVTLICAIFLIWIFLGSFIFKLGALNDARPLLINISLLFIAWVVILIQILKQYKSIMSNFQGEKYEFVFIPIDKDSFFVRNITLNDSYEHNKKSIKKVVFRKNIIIIIFIDKTSLFVMKAPETEKYFEEYKIKK